MAPESLTDRLRRHAHDVVNGGTNASELRADLLLAAEALAALAGHEESFVRVGQVWQDNDRAAQRTFRVVCVVGQKVGIRNVCTDRLSYLRVSRFPKCYTLITESAPAVYEQ